MIQENHESAKTNKVKIVNSCGFDSIPSDMGVYFIHKELKNKKQSIKSIDMRVAGVKGGISGGTYASLNNVIKESYEDKEIFKILSNPYSLNPYGYQDGKDRQDLRKVIYDKVSKKWIGPFIMASINTCLLYTSPSPRD